MTAPTHFPLVFACSLVVLVLPRGQAAEKAARIDYNRDIRPILSDRCYACHGPDEKQRKAKFRLDRKEDAFAELKRSGGRALVPGKPDESELFNRITAEGAGRMPPPKFAKPLDQKQIDLLKRWIEQGAEWQPHWAYIPVQRPSLPAVKLKGWGRNGLDAFILARLEAEGLRPSPEADKTTLLRRVTFDLTGLPPSLDEIDAFLADQSPDAYEKVVDRLLGSHRYGERMALHWLDLARYADTNGYHIDNHRDMWLWREWVIGAFNRNQPFDQFTIEQIAGDLLPGATTAQKIASGFNRNTMVNFEGGADPQEYLTKYVIDRINTTATVWLGTTLACAECHDHKYDPFTTKDFYRFYAFFNTIPERGLDGQKENPVPSLRVSTKEQREQLAQLEKKLSVLEKRIKTELSRVTLEEPVGPPPKPRGRADFVWVDDQLPPGATPNGHEGAASWKWVDNPVVGGKRATVRTATGLSQHFFQGASQPLRIGKGDKLFAHVWLDPKNPPKQIMLQFFDGNWEHRAYWGADLIAWGKPKSGSRLPVGPLPEAGQWVRLEVTPEAVGLKPGSSVSGLAFTQFDGTVYWDRAGLVTRTPQGPTPAFESLAEWEAWEKASPSPTLPAPVKKALITSPAKRNVGQKKALREHFLRYVHAPTRTTLKPLDDQQAKLKKQETALRSAMPSTMVMEEMASPRDTFILVRGNFQSRGLKVTAGVPEALPPLPKGAPANRLGLAKWLVMRENPLTARVTVNRYWEQVFGSGLVRTGENFGSQGEWPTHPELLDWLAAEFVDSGWDVKRFMRMLVTSAAYRQSARVTPELARMDPENRLLGRGPRFRLNAETIRDTALSVSGLLDGRIGGPSVRPYQPAGLWQQVSFGGGFSSQTYVQSKGHDLYRRGLYTYWKRSLPHPSLVTFDAPNREVCTDRRPRTNTPLQALVLLNDPIYVECARVLGQRVLKEGGTTTEERLSFAFKLCTGRVPLPEEMEILKRILDRQQARFKADRAAALKLVSVGEWPRPKEIDVSELAAWTAVGNVLLNLDEVITKG